MEKKKDTKKVEKVVEKKGDNKITKEKVQSVVIIILSLIIVFGLAFVVPELKNCGTCNEETVELTDITMDDYRALLKGSEVSLIYLASPSCGYCAQQKPVMEELIAKYGVTVNYLNTSNMSQEEADEVYALYGAEQEKRYETEGLRTPTILLVQNSKLLDMNLGNIELEELVAFLQNYTIVEE